MNIWMLQSAPHSIVALFTLLSDLFICKTYSKWNNTKNTPNNNVDDDNDKKKRTT